MVLILCIIDVVVARQMGFEDASEVPELCILAQEYLRKSKECDENIYEYISNADKDNVDSLYMKLVDEFERCILSYLAFHWNKATSLISMVYILTLLHSSLFFSSSFFLYKNTLINIHRYLNITNI